MSDIPPPGYTESTGPRRRQTTTNGTNVPGKPHTYRKYHDTKSKTHTNSHHHRPTNQHNFCSSVGAWIFGIALILASSYGHYQNEFSHVQMNSALKEVTGKVQPITGKSLKLTNYEQSLVHINSGIEITGQLPYDPIFKISDTCVRLKRVVEMYQWKESESSGKDENGKEYTDYSYEQGWHSAHQNSENFYQKNYQNPTFDVQNQIFTADRVAVKGGDIALGKEFTDQINWSSNRNQIFTHWHYFPRYENDHGKTDFRMFPEVSSQSRLGNQQPRIGDYRIQWEVYGVEKDQISVIGVLNGNRQLETFRPANLPDLALLNRGSLSATEMVTYAQKAANDSKWAFRLGLVVLAMIGFVLTAEPLNYVLRKVPIIGGVLESGTVTIAVILSLFWSVFVILTSCIIVKPMLWIGGILGAFGLFAFSKKSNIQENKPQNTEPQATSPPFSEPSQTNGPPFPEPTAPPSYDFPPAGESPNLYPKL